MGFLDKAKAAANDLAQKADTALASSGLGGPGAGAERFLRDLGVITYLDSVGRPVPETERERVLTALRDLEQRGEIGALTLQTTAAQATVVPPPPGAAGQAPPPPAAPTQAAPPLSATPAQDAPPPPPPPPPSWAKDES